MAEKAIKYDDLVLKIRVILNQTEENDFSERLNQAFKQTIELVKYGVSFAYAPYERQNQKKTVETIPYEKFKDALEMNMELVKRVVASYLKGNLFDSICAINEWWKKVVSEGAFPYAPVREGYTYYRTRLKESTTIFQEKDMFHVPFDKRGNVTTKRYSIPGYPCLYLGKSIYVCWEEMRRPALSDFATSAFKAQEDIYMLDLRLRKKMYSHENCLYFLYMLPILIGCSFKVRAEEDNFKPEYILPQILLHVIIVQHQNGETVEKPNSSENISIEGIVYNSVAASSEEFNFTNYLTTYYLADCIVLPVKIQDDNKWQYCQNLAKKFKISTPKYYENEYIKDSLAFLKVCIRDYLDAYANESEHAVIKKRYENSYFSFMEKSWKDSDFKSLTPTILKA